MVPSYYIVDNLNDLNNLTTQSQISLYYHNGSEINLDGFAGSQYIDTTHRKLELGKRWLVMIGGRTSIEESYLKYGPEQLFLTSPYPKLPPPLYIGAFRNTVGILKKAHNTLTGGKKDTTIYTICIIGNIPLVFEHSGLKTKTTNLNENHDYFSKSEVLMTIKSCLSELT